MSFRFGRNRRRVLLLAWLTLLPDIGPFPLNSQTRDIGLILPFDNKAGTGLRHLVTLALLYGGKAGASSASARMGGVIRHEKAC
jgi:hypothetical protein